MEMKIAGKLVSWQDLERLKIEKVSEGERLFENYEGVEKVTEKKEREIANFRRAEFGAGAPRKWCGCTKLYVRLKNLRKIWCRRTSTRCRRTELSTKAKYLARIWCGRTVLIFRKKFRTVRDHISRVQAHKRL